MVPPEHATWGATQAALDAIAAVEGLTGQSGAGARSAPPPAADKRAACNQVFVGSSADTGLLFQNGRA